MLIKHSIDVYLCQLCAQIMDFCQTNSFLLLFGILLTPQENLLPEMAWVVDAFYKQSSADLALWCLVHTCCVYRPMWFDWDWWQTFRWVCWWEDVSVRLMDLSSPSVCTYRGVHIWPNYLGSVWVDSSFRAEGDSQETASSLIPPLQIQLSCPCFSLSLLHSPPPVRSSSSLLWVHRYSKDIHGGVLNIPRQTLNALKSSSLLESLELHVILFILSDNSLFLFDKTINIIYRMWVISVSESKCCFPLKFIKLLLILSSTCQQTVCSLVFLDIKRIEGKSNTADSIWQNGTMSHQQSDCGFTFLWQISITEHLKQLTDAHRDFGLRHGEYNQNVIIKINIIW